MRPLIFGTGAVGLGLGSALLAAGHRPRFVARAETARLLETRGVSRTGILGERHDPPSAFDVASEVDAFTGAPADTVLVCTKSFDSQSVAETLAASSGQVAPDAPIVLCQNGWGNADHFTPHFGQERVFAASVMTGFRRTAPNTSDITVHAQPIRVGSLAGFPSTRVVALAAALTMGGIPCEPTDEMEAELWAKILYNSCLNPLGAVLGRRYGALAEDPEAKATMDALAHETFSVMDAAGFRTHWSGADEWLTHFYAALVPPTAAHESSMLQDLRAGRRTEIDTLTGAIVRLAEAHGVPAPTHRALLAQVRSAEAGR
jgi:2-dehydropantoate 2-reductase